MHGNPVSQGFAYEEFALASLYKDPASFTNGKIKSIDHIVRFDGTSSVDLRPHGTTLYWPRKWNLQYVDGVIRTRTADKLLLVAIQVTVQPLAKHKDSLSFFSVLQSPASYHNWLLADEQAAAIACAHVLLWIAPAKPKKLPTSSSATNIAFAQECHTLSFS